MNKIIILLGQRVRSGTNFVGSTIAQHPHVSTLPKDISLGEFNLFYTDTVTREVYDKITRNSFGMEFTSEDKSAFIKNYGQAWLSLLIDKYRIESDKTIFIKSPSVAHIDLWKLAFPDSKIAVICRDGRDNVISSVRASNDKRDWHDISIKLKKRVNFFSGRSFINHTKQWVKTARQIVSITQDNQVKVFKYEMLNDSKTEISNLLSHYDLDVNEDILDNCLKAPVVGSSFGVSSKKMVKPNWKPDSDKSKFKFSNKWKKWNLIKKMTFKAIAGKELINLGFEKNSKW
ncbi:sulfotransferase [uncultured Psychroserpens sp.]|uniref:sulfotransferase n=1 Tax=uncultured Psychroserpens sp. TaxID=255436 RepID=UPI0026133BC1|nr:sulfotransferase [uncultured Psychroserpens sp.]